MFLLQLLVLPLQPTAPSEEEETASDAIGVEKLQQNSQQITVQLLKRPILIIPRVPQEMILFQGKKDLQLGGQMSQQRVSTQELLRIWMSW